MTLSEKYWMTILLVFCRYLSILLLIGPAAFFFIGRYIDVMWYLGLISWPLTFMIGLVNLRYIRLICKKNKLEWNKILEN